MTVYLSGVCLECRVVLCFEKYFSFGFKINTGFILDNYISGMVFLFALRVSDQMLTFFLFKSNAYLLSPLLSLSYICDNVVFQRSLENL